MSKPLMRSSRGGFRPPLVQMSRDSLLDGRGRSGSARRRVSGEIGADREQFRRRWSLLMIASFGSREACAVHFARTFQTACNWFDGVATPSGEVVHHAIKTLPRYGEIMVDE